PRVTVLVTQLAADLAAREVPGAGVDRAHAVVRVDVDVGVARLDGVDQVRKRMSGKGPDEIGGSERPLREDAVVAPRSERPRNGRGARVQPDDDRAVRTSRPEVD